ncbi:MAG: hypothetical protein A2521_12630 [Deltaproteobacteria bacterium RIFOXYD12_FULL_57_12]|nr:MAG: hypothetical protein A2521_12630 [Deltaproteobacteria bacterium RIFOXYD12_FULL_57_12]
MNPAMTEIFEAGRAAGWILEPEAKTLLAAAGLDVPRFARADNLEAALAAASQIGYPLVAKVVSPGIIHKSDVGGVVVGVGNDGQLREVFQRFRTLDPGAAILVEEMLPRSVELIVGAKIDYQFGPVILLGIGGTGVEIYQDTAIRMAPLKESDVPAMIRGLKGRRLLEGYRGSAPVHPASLARLLLAFSGLVMEVADRIESIDLNPVLCFQERCVVADARIMLRRP